MLYCNYKTVVFVFVLCFVCLSRGRQKKSTEPPVHLRNPTLTHPPADLFLQTFQVRCWLELKNAIKISGKKSMSKTSPQKNDKMEVFPRICFCFVPFLGVSRQLEFKTTTKGRVKYQKGKKPAKTNVCVGGGRTIFITSLSLGVSWRGETEAQQNPVRPKRAHLFWCACTTRCLYYIAASRR
jgi:hypothetical protein